MTIGEQHIVKAFDEQLGALTDAIARMGGLAETQLAAALDALGERDNELASQVMNNDRKVDACEEFVNEQTIRVLALRAPVADDLRVVITALKVAGDLERVADHAANCAKRALVINQMQPVAPLRSLLRMGRMVCDLLKDSLDAYLSHDAERAGAVRLRDQDIDNHYSSLFREILTYMVKDPRTITACSHLMFIAKNIERIGDHATNIAEMTHFLVTGRSLTDQRPKRDNSAFVGGEV